jgi:hypothetical protein
MWTISSNDVELAKQRVERRRVEIEARYAAEKTTLEAEVAVIEALESVAVEFAQRHSLSGAADATMQSPEKSETPSQPSAAGEPPGDAEPVEHTERTQTWVEPETVSGMVVEPEPAGGTDSDPAYDILKPGSRWRFNRAARLLNPEDAPVTSP